MSNLVVNIQSFEYPKQWQDEITGIDNIRFEARPEEILCLVGKNGSCKTTLARILCGQLPPKKGTVAFGGATLLDGRSVGYLAQDYPLFPWLKVKANIEFPLKMLNLNVRLPSLLNDFIAKSDIKDHLNNYPHQLSGGQRQQVALVQALVLNPSLLIMDEPYSALSQKAKTDVKELVKELKRDGKIVVQVVHDFADTIDTSTRILVMNAIRDRRYTVVADLPLESETREKPLSRDQFAKDMAALAFQDAMMPLSQDKVQQKESSFSSESEVVVVALDPQREYKPNLGFSFLPVVAKNLKKGVKYTYAFPGFSNIATDIQSLQKDGSSLNEFVEALVKETSLNRTDIGKLLRIFVVEPSKFRYADFVVVITGGIAIDGWEFPTIHPHIIFETDRSKLQQKLKTVLEVFQNKEMARQVFP